MLTLTRKPGEKIYIGEEITLIVVATHPHKVVLGLEAPLSVNIERDNIKNRRPRIRNDITNLGISSKKERRFPER